MDLELHTCPIQTVETVLDSTVENAFDLDIHLPDYCPDIQRILRCTVTPNIHSVSAGTDRITAEGNGVMRMLYAAENKQVVSFEQTFPINKNYSWSQESDVSLSAFAQTEFANCRASGQRKASIHGVISIRFRGQKQTQRNVVIGSENASVQMRCKEAKTISNAACAERNFAMSEVVEVGASNPTIGQILRSFATVSVESIKAIKDKLLIKGELLTEVAYIGEGSDELCRFRHVMPVSQILESAGIEEENVQDISLCVVSIETTPKADGSGEQKLLEIAARVQATLYSGKQISLQTVQDAYSTQGTLQPEYQKMEFCSLMDEVKESLTAKDTFDLSGEGIASLIDVSCGSAKITHTLRDDTLEFTGETSVCILYRDLDGNPAVAEKSMTFTCKKILSEKTQKVQCTPMVQIAGCKPSLSAEGKVEVRLDVLLSCMVYSVSEERVLVSAQVAEETEQQEKSALTIYFTDSGEDIWDIARQYKTTTQAIMTENELSAEIIEEKRMLMIPRA